MATNDEIVSEARLTCEDKVIEKDTCEDLCNDSKYFLRRLQRYDNKLFKHIHDIDLTVFESLSSCLAFTIFALILSYISLFVIILYFIIHSLYISRFC